MPYPTYIPYIGPNNAPLGVKCQGRVVTCFRGRNKFKIMQIRVERPQNRVWVLENNFFELTNLTCSTWGNMHNVHTCEMAKNAKIGQQKA